MNNIFKTTKQQQKKVDRAIAKYNEEKSIMLEVKFDSILDLLKASDKLNKILDKI